eukprot:TRINITY_DN4323_c0_g1_i3.p1 TRINITY_DN4323_c0_g1~~TRINITY_DN4323_c0_g1_i3.p1  ORF type:complete len:670 (-),score=133.51 TRINITY_DN4323_c0_g1_i3:98-2107(-)
MSSVHFDANKLEKARNNNTHGNNFPQLSRRSNTTTTIPTSSKPKKSSTLPTDEINLSSTYPTPFSSSYSEPPSKVKPKSISLASLVSDTLFSTTPNASSNSLQTQQHQQPLVCSPPPSVRQPLPQIKNSLSPPQNRHKPNSSHALKRSVSPSVLQTSTSSNPFPVTQTLQKVPSNPTPTVTLSRAPSLQSSTLPFLESPPPPLPQTQIVKPPRRKPIFTEQEDVTLDTITHSFSSNIVLFVMCFETDIMEWIPHNRPLINARLSFATVFFDNTTRKVKRPSNEEGTNKTLLLKDSHRPLSPSAWKAALHSLPDRPETPDKEKDDQLVYRFLDEFVYCADLADRIRIILKAAELFAEEVMDSVEISSGSKITPYTLGNIHSLAVYERGHLLLTNDQWLVFPFRDDVTLDVYCSVERAVCLFIDSLILEFLRVYWQKTALSCAKNMDRSNELMYLYNLKIIKGHMSRLAPTLLRQAGFSDANIHSIILKFNDPSFRPIKSQQNDLAQKSWSNWSQEEWLFERMWVEVRGSNNSSLNPMLAEWLRLLDLSTFSASESTPCNSCGNRGVKILELFICPKCDKHSMKDDPTVKWWCGPCLVSHAVQSHKAISQAEALSTEKCYCGQYHFVRVCTKCTRLWEVEDLNNDKEESIHQRRCLEGNFRDSNKSKIILM